MRFGSLFAGIGGLDLGLERAGMTCAFQVERNPWCQRVLAKHWPDVPRYADIREVDPDGLPAVDLLAGGFPCQPHSLAGKRGASADDRDLWSEFARLIRGARPRWVLAENVPGLLSSEAGRYFGGVLRDLAGLGYDAEWQVLSAAGRGAPHIRRRVFLVAHANGVGRQGRPRLLGPGGKPEPADGRQDVADADRERRQEREPAPEPARSSLLAWGADAGGRDWGPEPGVGRVADGVPRRMDRLGGLGNAVAPDCAEYVGRLILAA